MISQCSAAVCGDWIGRWDPVFISHGGGCCAVYVDYRIYAGTRYCLFARNNTICGLVLTIALVS